MKTKYYIIQETESIMTVKYDSRDNEFIISCPFMYLQLKKDDLSILLRLLQKVNLAIEAEENNVAF